MFETVIKTHLGSGVHRMLVPAENPSGWLYVIYMEGKLNSVFVPFGPKLYHDEPVAAAEESTDNVVDLMKFLKTNKKT